jgi:hypothetical protein
MKKIVITEEQAKKLVGLIINEQNVADPNSADNTKERRYSFNGYNGSLGVLYKNGQPYVINPETKELEELVRLSEIKIIINKNKKPVPDDNTRFGIELAEYLTELGFNYQKYGGLGFYVVCWDDIKYNLPYFMKINVLPSDGMPFKLDELQMVSEKNGSEIIAGKTRSENYAISGQFILDGDYVPSEDDGGTKVTRYYFCVQTEGGKNTVVSAEYEPNEKVNVEDFVGAKDPTHNEVIKSGTGPYKTAAEARQNCNKKPIPKLPEVVPFGEYFPNNVSAIKVPTSSEFVKKLTEFFNAGGTLKKITIKASASKVPAGSVENDKNSGLWRDNKNYDTAAVGNNDDKTGNLQLTKARAYNLYLELLNIFPQLKSVPHELIALGSIGDEWKPGMAPDAANYSNYRKVDLILDK